MRVVTVALTKFYSWFGGLIGVLVKWGSGNGALVSGRRIRWYREFSFLVDRVYSMEWCNCGGDGVTIPYCGEMV